MYQRDQDKQKSLLAKAAIQYLEKGMVLGLGTGSTIDIFISELSKFENLLGSLKIVATSKVSAKKARVNRMNVIEPDKCLELDICIDGADEVDRNLSMIKGGGGALLWEKIVAYRASKRIYLADESKQVTQLGAFPLPVEIIDYGHEWSAAAIEPLFKSVRLRKEATGNIFKTDSNNVIYDCFIKDEEDTANLGSKLSAVPGVVTSGLFGQFIDILLTCRDGDVQEISSRENVFW
tara:strand:- start:162 stop:866 length:705 start_codon:yes stop_codon:yes gene_type:complete